MKKASDEFIDAIKVHNALQARYEKAEKILEETENPPEHWLKAFDEIRINQHNNFERFYKIFEKADLNSKVKSDKILTVADFEDCKIL